MAWRWAGAVLLDVEKQFQRIKSHRDLGQFLTALGRGPQEAELALRKEVA
jgi:hypothetical protein